MITRRHSIEVAYTYSRRPLDRRRELVIHFPCGKFGDCNFSRFGSIAFNMFFFTLWLCDLDLWLFDLIFIIQQSSIPIIIVSTIPAPSVTILVLAISFLSCGQTDRQTDRHRESQTWMTAILVSVSNNNAYFTISYNILLLFTGNHQLWMWCVCYVLDWFEFQWNWRWVFCVFSLNLSFLPHDALHESAVYITTDVKNVQIQIKNVKNVKKRDKNNVCKRWIKTLLVI